jgi:hypothetical protein
VKKAILRFGLISGAIQAGLMVVAMVFSDKIGIDRGYVVGYTSMVLSFLLVFFGIRAYRDEAGGVITFGRAFGLGMAITLISCVCYVVAWEILYYFFMPDFFDKFGAHAVEKARAAGESAAQIAAVAEQFRKYKEMYANPLINAAMTFIEPFPVGLLITLISATVLRKKAVVSPAKSTMAAGG